MRILSIETSCDDTCITLLDAKKNFFEILANAAISQGKLHSAYGGIYPNLAKNEHIKNLPILLKRVLKKSKASKPDLIVVTSGPGLEPCLWAGITFAEDLAKKWKVPLVPVNHMEGHVLSVFAKGKKFSIPNLHPARGGASFPILSLLVSGGHTQLVLTKKGFKHEIIGETLDDAVGEAFDKVARMLGLPYPGGPEISRLASQARKFKIKNSKLKIKFPRPMLKSNNFNFSFAGLKTAVLYKIRDLKKAGQKLTHELITELSLEFENAAIETLVYKTAKALEKYKAKTLIVAGGVAANRHLREEIRKVSKNVLFPTPELATDNAIMIGMAGYLNYLKNPKKKYKIRANGGLRLGEMIK